MFDDLEYLIRGCLSAPFVAFFLGLLLGWLIWG